MKFLDELKFGSDGLIPCVVQDWKDGAVLMVAYMNRESIQKTIQTRKATFWSRSRQKFWVKGEQSGNVQKLKGLFYDCDGDCLLVTVDQVGKAACHTGHRSCFYRKVNAKGIGVVQGKKVFDPKKVYA